MWTTICFAFRGIIECKTRPKVYTEHEACTHQFAVSFHKKNKWDTNTGAQRDYHQRATRNPTQRISTMCSLLLAKRTGVHASVCVCVTVCCCLLGGIWQVVHAKCHFACQVVRYCSHCYEMWFAPSNGIYCSATCVGVFVIALLYAVVQLQQYIPTQTQLTQKRRAAVWAAQELLKCAILKSHAARGLHRKWDRLKLFCVVCVCFCRPIQYTHTLFECNYEVVMHTHTLNPRHVQFTTIIIAQKAGVTYLRSDRGKKARPRIAITARRQARYENTATFVAFIDKKSMCATIPSEHHVRTLML